MTTGGVVAAVDLGATSGRVMLGYVDDGMLRLEQVARFPNGPVPGPDGLHWDFSALYRHIVDGLAEAFRREPGIASIGIDSWAVDYGLVHGGELLAEPFHYRDERTARGVEAVHAETPFAELYRRNGLQFLPFNTLYQYAVEERLSDADVSLLIPDLVAFLLTGVRVAERTNASTTGLVDVRTGEWDLELAARLGIPASVLPPLVDPGEHLGTLHGEARERIGAPLEVIAVGSHDTASAVVAVPLSTPDAAYISCGTWGLVGVELDEPVVSDAAREANFTNEGGVDGRVRFLHNVTGLWLLSEAVRTWEAEDGAAIDLPRLLDAAAEVVGDLPLFDANDPRLSAPGDMPARIGGRARRTRRRGAGDPRGVRPHDRREHRPGVRRRRRDRRPAHRPRHRRDPHRRRRRAQPAAVPGDGGPLRPSGARRSGRGDRTRQCARAGARARLVRTRRDAGRPAARGRGRRGPRPIRAARVVRRASGAGPGAAARPPRSS